MDNAKINSLLSELKRLKAKQEGGITAELIFDLTQKLEGVKELEKKFEDTVKEIKASVPNLDTMFRSVKGNMGEQGEKGEKGDEGDSIKGERGLSGKDGEDGKDGKDGQNGRDGIDGRDGATGPSGLNGSDGSPDTGEIIVSKLESLEEENKLKIEAVKNLRDELDKLEKKIKLGGRVIYSGNGGGGKIVKAEDISSQLNGVLKTFSLPAFFRVISIHSSSFPNAFRLTTDYTVDGSAFTVSFSSEIDASTVLSAGQTVIVLFSEM